MGRLGAFFKLFTWIWLSMACLVLITAFGLGLAKSTAHAAGIVAIVGAGMVVPYLILGIFIGVGSMIFDAPKGKSPGDTWNRMRGR